MNERIKIYELAKQAGLIEFDTLPWNPDAVTPDYESYSKAMKFAELIIKECYDVVMTGDRYRRDYFAEKILIHFGMSEYENTTE